MNSEAHIKITDMAFGGDGIGRLDDGRVVFVPFTTPGDEVNIALTEQKKTYCRGEIRQIITPGSQRTEPKCPHFGTCGGCRWQHINYPAQLALKRKMLVSELSKKTKNIDFDKITAQIEPSSPYAYRTAARVQVQKGKIGFFQEKTNTIVPISQCPVLSSRLQELVTGLKTALAPTKLDGFLEISEDFDGLTGVSIHSEFKVKIGLIERVKRYADTVLVDGNTKIDEESFMNGHGFFYIPGEFVQKNNEINRKLKKYLEKLIRTDIGTDTFVELFAGSGNLTHLLADLFKHGVAAESSHLSSELLSRNLAGKSVKVIETNLYKNPRQVLAKTADMMARTGHPNDGPDLIIADPPRAGLKNWSKLIHDIQPENVILISCYPPVFAYDANRIIEDGKYDAVSIRPFDMFPQTAHFEVVGHFTKLTM